MPNEIVKLGISPDGTGFEEKLLAAVSVVAADGTTAETHIADTAKHTSSAEKTKLAGIATAAQVNVIEGIKRNGTALTVSGKAVDIAVPTKVSELTNDSGFLTASSTLSAAKISGVLPIASMPPAAVERLTIVATDTARYALTTSTVQNGDTVKVTATGKMYYVKDQTQLASANGYEEYTAGAASAVAWGGITGKPTTLSGFGITDAEPKRTQATQAEAEAGTGTTVRAWTPLQVRQAANKAATAAISAAGLDNKKDIVFVANEAAIATSGVCAGGIVLMKV